MAQFSVTITIPDGQLAGTIAGLKTQIVQNIGETNLAYIKRVTRELLFDTAKQGMTQIAQSSLSVGDPGITTS